VGEIENRVRYALNQAIAFNEAIPEGEENARKLEAIEVIFDVLMPLIEAQREAIMLLAREVDQLRGNS
jgi:hypothetical protein